MIGNGSKSIKIEVYGDGSAIKEGQPGGYGFVICFNGEKIHEDNGHMESASNNDAELEAAIQGLAHILKMRNEHMIPIEEHEIYFVSDSQIVLGWINGTYRFKQQRKYHKYEQIQYLVRKLNIKTRWVRGHDGDEHNERCDKLANLGRLKMSPTDTLPGKNARKRHSIKESKVNNSIGLKKKGTISIWYKNVLKVICLDANLVEDYEESKHGKRDSYLGVK